MNFYEQLFSRGRTTGEGMTHFERLFAAKFGGSPPPEVREYTGAVPVTITADGTPLIDYLISGNTTQSGTPTPDSPIMPEGTGERTGNLLRNEQTQTVVENNGITFTRNSDGSITANGTATARAKYQYYGLGAWKYAYDTDYFLSGCPTGGSTRTYSILIDSTTTQFCDTGSGRVVNLATGATGNYNFEIRVENGVSVENLVFKPMLNLGSTALPYEPWGIKIPISSNNTTTPVYLGGVQSTRRIKKLVLTGKEGWQRTVNKKCYYIDMANGCPTDYLKQKITTSICSHYRSQNNTGSGSNEVEAGHFCFYIGGGFELYLGETTILSVADFKTYLQQQYANGTPVTIYYVLATPKTAVVNEPLMKIGDYADTLSKEQALVSIPTNNCSTTVDVDTTVKPSEVYIKYMG